MVYHVAQVLSVAGKEAILRLIDAQVLTLDGTYSTCFNSEFGAIKFMEQKKAEYRKANPTDTQPVRFVVVTY